MKKRIKFNIIILISLVFASCGSNFSITKRHYTRGYYINHSNNKVIAKNTSNEASQPVIGLELNEETNSSNKKTHENISALVKDTTVEKTSVVSDVPVTHSTVPTNYHQNASKKMENTAHHTNSKRNLKPFFEINHLNTKKIKSSNTAARDHEHLSLLWVVILVILILWAVGYLAVGLTGLINLLLLIALILFILWLLRVL
ncbi:MAG TPA: hypothetical protein VK177_21055 [Flavobacteriales bacterium]|nr:hypothetical protein [Flavobacteriales bacterium]